LIGQQFEIGFDVILIWFTTLVGYLDRQIYIFWLV